MMRVLDVRAVHLARQRFAYTDEIIGGKVLPTESDHEES